MISKVEPSKAFFINNMKNFKRVVIIIILISLALTANFLFRSEFKSGQCVKNNNDEYIWQVNNFSFGKYRAMGWQDGAWGNAVVMEKNILERTNVNGIKVYNRTACPEYRPK